MFSFNVIDLQGIQIFRIYVCGRLGFVKSSGDYLLAFYKSGFDPGTVHLGHNVTGTVFFSRIFCFTDPDGCEV